MNIEDLHKISGKAASAKKGENSYDHFLNVLSVPKGNTFELILSDGTKVILNSLSNFKFPDEFSHGKRQVYLEGEGYFKVASNIEKPFIVTLTDSVDVEVLGTEFNVRAYKKDVNIETTLFEGSVQLNVQAEHRKYKQMMVPGQFANISRQKLGEVVLKTFTNNPSAWLEGYFDFNEADLSNIASQIAINYDIRVIVGEKSETIKFYGQVERNLPLSKIIRVLEDVGVNCEFKNKTLFINP